MVIKDGKTKDGETAVEMNIKRVPICPKCDTELRKDWVYCPECGTRIERK